ncbi:MAG TPA: RDD family protein [Chitinophagaceae bacterium]|nr:RDD family protein [Chitinophagaceae bacterium]
MVTIKLDTGFNIQVEFALAAFHKRFFALMIDILLQIAYLWMGYKLMNYIWGSSWDNATWHVILFALPYIFYHLFMEIGMNGQSVGKKLLHIRVMTLEGGQPSISQYLIRWIFRIIDFPIFYILAASMGYLNPVTLIFIVAGLLFVIFTPRSQRIGDLVAGTMLIDIKSRTSWEDTVFTELDADYQPTYPQVMQLSDRDVNTLKSIIESVKKKNDYELSMRIADRIKSKLHMESDQPSLEFLETLLKDYNYYATH